MTMTDNFYSCFRERFRGTREEIKRRLTAYLPIIEPLKILQPKPAALDLGCGRGEWLELMSMNGFSAKGVDSDETARAFCTEQGFDVHTADALEYLGSVPDASLAIVTGFHIAEHLPFETLRSLMREARRALMPGGILILETPNPENLAVGSCSFYVDPTHRAPLPPPLLSFLAEDAGFKRVKTLRLNHPPEESFSGARTPSLAKVVWGVSPDYSIIAQTHAESSILESFAWFNTAEETHSSLHQRLEVFDTEVDRAVQQIISAQTQMERAMQQVSNRQSQTEKTVQQILSAYQAQRSEYETQRSAYESQRRELEMISASYSWKLTSPLRSINKIRRDLMRPSDMTGPPGSLPKRMFKAVLRPVVLRMLARPRVFNAIHRGLEPFPALRALLARFVFHAPSTESAGQVVKSEAQYGLSKKAARILDDLKEAISRREGS